MNTTEVKPIAKAIKARNLALSRLQENHQDEWKEILADERTKLGLSPTSAGSRSKKTVAENTIKRLKALGLDTSALEQQLETTNW